MTELQRTLEIIKLQTTMKTEVAGKTIVWWDVFSVHPFDEEPTFDFSDKILSGKAWIDELHDSNAKQVAQFMIKHLGVKGTRRRVLRWAYAMTLMTSLQRKRFHYDNMGT